MKTKYRLSFGIGKAYTNERSLILQKYSETNNWKRNLKLCLESKVIQFNLFNSQTRVLRKVSLILQSLDYQEQGFFLKRNYIDPTIPISIVICSTYKFIDDFLCMIISDKITIYKSKLVYYNFYFFYEKELNFYEVIILLQDSNRKKLRQWIF